MAQIKAWGRKLFMPWAEKKFTKGIIEEWLNLFLVGIYSHNFIAILIIFYFLCLFSIDKVPPHYVMMSPCCNKFEINITTMFFMPFNLYNFCRKYYFF